MKRIDKRITHSPTNTRLRSRGAVVTRTAHVYAGLSAWPVVVGHEAVDPVALVDVTVYAVGAHVGTFAAAVSAAARVQAGAHAGHLRHSHSNQKQRKNDSGLHGNALRI